MNGFCCTLKSVPFGFGLLAILLASCSDITPPPQDPVITSHPTTTFITEGNTATFTVAAISTATLNYQWITSTDGGITWTDIVGETTNTYTTATVTYLADNNHIFRCIVTNALGSHYTSRAATLFVTPAPPVITLQPINTTVLDGDDAIFTVAATSDAPITYQWKRGGVNVGTNSPTYTLPNTVYADDEGATFTCTLSNTGGSVTSNVATLTITPILPTINDPTDLTVTDGAQASFTAFATVGTAIITYQWESSSDGGTVWNNITGAINALYTIDAVEHATDDGLMLRCTATNAFGSDTSLEVTLTVTPVPITIISQPTDFNGLEGMTASCSVEATGTAPITYQWQLYDDVGTVWNNIALATSDTYTTPTIVLADDGKQYRCVMANPAGSGVISNVATFNFSTETIIPGLNRDSGSYGKSIAIEGDTIVTGNPAYYSGTTFNEGRVRIFDWNSGTSNWDETVINSPMLGETGYFGTDVAINGDRMLISLVQHASLNTRVYVYDLVGGVWTESTTLQPTDFNYYDDFGDSLAIDGDTIVVGSHDKSVAGESSAGGAYIYEWNDSSWDETILELATPEWIDSFGCDVAISGNRVVIGATGRGVHGAAYLYEKSGSVWTQTEEFVSNGVETYPYAQFGSVVAIENDTIAIGAPSFSDSAYCGGAVFVYQWNSGTSNWDETLLEESTPNTYDYFGTSVAMDNGRILAGKPSIVSSENAYLYTWNGSSWNKAEYTPSVPQSAMGYGNAVDLSGNTIVIGAPNVDNSTFNGDGAIYIYK